MSFSTSVVKQIPIRRLEYPGLIDGFVSDYPEDLSHLAHRCKSADREVEAGRDLFCMGDKGDAIYSLVKGWVALHNLLEDGRKQILQFALPGAVLAFVPSHGAMMPYGAQALTHATVRIVSHERLGRLSRDNREFGMRLAGVIAKDRCLAYDHLASIGRRSARERVAYLLLELFVRSRMQWPAQRTQEMHLPLSQEQLGDATGLTGVHVNRVLRDLRQDGILEFRYRRLHILNADKLVEIARPESHVASSWLDVASFNEAIPKFYRD